MGSIRLVVLAVLTAVHLLGCVATETRPTAELDETARGLLAQGRYAEAADEFLRLADSTRGDQSQLFLLNAAGALIADHQLESALTLLEGRVGGVLPEGHARKRAALLAEIALAQQRPGDVLRLLPRPLVANSPPNIRRGMMELRATAYGQFGNHLEAAREAAGLDFLGLAPERARANRRFIWAALQQLDASALEAARVAPPNTFGGWVELAAIALAFGFEHTSFEEGVNAWRSRFPAHPADVELVGELLEETRARTRPPAAVALLLPLQGSFAEAARAVRDGFLGAWFTDGASAQRPTITIHSTSEADVAALYRAVVEAGAEFVVGPLRKSSVAALADEQITSVPTLTLNLLPSADSVATFTNLYQFALSPEDEAAQVAERAWFDGHGRAAVIAPQSPWGSRLAEAFSTAWEQLGGHVVEIQLYPTEGEDESQPPNMSAPVELLLNLDESERRARSMRQLLGRRVHFEPRRRDDIDFIFMAGFPREARQLRPQLRFHDAATVPIYSTSHVFTGSPNAQSDGDIDDIIFGDMPWVLEHFSASARVRDTTLRLWPNRARAYPRLYGFGADAYRLIVQLRRLQAAPGAVYEGHTGKLWLDEHRRVRRRLQWARFENGLPEPIESEPSIP